MLNEEVRNIMTKDPVVVKQTHTIQEVTDLMRTNKLQQMPVVENGKLIGIVTSYDLWRYERDNDNSMSQTVSKVMNSNVLVIAPKDKVATAAQLFIDRRFKTLPVVNLDNDLKGVVTAFDVIKYTYKKEIPNPILYKDVLEA